MDEYDIGYPHSKAKRTVKDGYRTIKNRIKAFELGKDYYDGDREDGYGGFKYDGRWAKIIPSIIERYNLTNKSAVLDLGCKKGFFMHDLKEALLGIKVRGIECSQYPIDNAMESVKDDIILSGYEKLPFEDNEFDFVLGFAAIYMLNLQGVMNALREIQRVGKGKSYITLGAYRTEEERDTFLKWTLLGTTILHVDEWLEVFNATGYTGDYFFTTASSVHVEKE
jgi:ubiquinone/menaquinone biosynthesis C-methylase UbiE